MAELIIGRTARGGIKFYIKDGKRTLASSEVFASETSCLHCIAEVRRLALSPVVRPDGEKAAYPFYEIYLDKAGAYRFRLLVRKNNMILKGGPLPDIAGCEKSIKEISDSLT